MSTPIDFVLSSISFIFFLLNVYQLYNESKPNELVYYLHRSLIAVSLLYCAAHLHYDDNISMFIVYIQYALILCIGYGMIFFIVYQIIKNTIISSKMKINLEVDYFIKLRIMIIYIWLCISCVLSLILLAVLNDFRYYIIYLKTLVV